MSAPDGRCATAREALPELALGIADGEQRALALEHTAGCPECRQQLEQLSSVADDLIALVPSREPPPGFESRVLDRLGMRRAERRPAHPRLRRLALAVPALAATAIAIVIAMNIAYSSDRRLASQYRAALQGAHGKYFQSARLHTAAGQAGGIVFAYQGSPSWLFYVLDGRDASGAYRERIVTRSGVRFSLPAFRLVDLTWGIATPVPVRDIARVELIRQPRGPTFEATLPVVEP